MVLVMIIVAIASGALTTLALWPVLGAGAIVAAPFGASLTAMAVAAWAWLRPEVPATAEPWLDRLTDRLVLELRRLAGSAETRASRREQRRKAG